jgi:MFS superfamily sulfate permease-like transporter
MGTEKSPNNHWGADVTAGLTTGIANIPDVMASAILAGTKVH